MDTLLMEGRGQEVIPKWTNQVSQSNKWHGWDFGYEIINPANAVKISHQSSECKHNLNEFQFFPMPYTFLSFIMSSSDLQYGLSIWGKVGADIVDRQREINILPTHKTISYRSICSYVHEFLPWSSVSFPAPWSVCSKLGPQHGPPRCSHILYSICMLSTWVFGWRQHWKLEEIFGTFAISFLPVSPRILTTESPPKIRPHCIYCCRSEQHRSNLVS